MERSREIGRPQRTQGWVGSDATGASGAGVGVEVVIGPSDGATNGGDRTAVRSPGGAGRILPAVLALLRRGPRVGGLYSVALDDRGFAMVKVLVASRGVLHVRVYSNRYAERPSAIDPAQLYVVPARDMSDAALNATHPEERADPGPFGIGHLPIRPTSFAAWQPRLVRMTRVERDELEGYETWRQSRGGIFR
jgi:hypothetical protein